MRQVQQQTTQQQLALTQQMRSALSLLQMGPDEIAGAIDAEARRNPFLKPVPAGGAGVAMADGETPRAELAAESSPIDDIIRQISLIRLTPEEQDLAIGLAHSLDERGFLSDPADEICAYLKVKPSTLVAVVGKLQSAIEPAGVFAWSLAESFRLQLKAKGRFDPMIEALLTRIDLIAAQDIKAICETFAVDPEDAEDMMADIRALSPAPLAPPPPPHATARAPDLILRPDLEGVVTARLNEAALPKLLADDAMFSAVEAAETEDAALAYYRDCYRSAAGFVLALQKRANTLLRIGEVIAETQARFIATGRDVDRKPLTMVDIAAALEMNKSTVSRALNDCLIDTAHGVLPAARFIVRAIGNDVESRTQEQALKRLSLLIRTEDGKRPLSDRALADQMARANFPISRRTVAKYRGLLGIPSTRDRRTGGPSRPQRRGD